MHDVEGMRRFTDLLSQVGITAFALMFAAIQIRWQGVGEGSRRARDLSVTRHGKLAAITALWELLTVTLVSVAFSAATREVVGTSATPAVPPNGDFMWTWGWRAVAVACAGTGYVLAVSHVRETRNQRRLGHVATLADRFQASWGFAPFASYGILIVVALWPADATPYSWFAAVLVWFLLSGLLEVWVTLSPSMLEAEMDNIPRLVTIDAKDQSGGRCLPAASSASNSHLMLAGLGTAPSLYCPISGVPSTTFWPLVIGCPATATGLSSSTTTEEAPVPCVGWATTDVPEPKQLRSAHRRLKSGPGYANRRRRRFT